MMFLLRLPDASNLGSAGLGGNRGQAEKTANRRAFSARRNRHACVGAKIRLVGSN
jgi:hypothetical protein